MRTIFIFVIFVIAAICSGIQGKAQASSYDPKIQALYSPGLIDAIIHEQIDKHKGIDLTVKDYIYNDPQSIADREFADDVRKLDKSKERYNGR